MRLTCPSGSERSVTVDYTGCLPTPPASPAKSAKHKSSFSQKISRVNTLIRGPFEGSSSHKQKQKERRSAKSSQQSVAAMDVAEAGSVHVFSPESSKTVTTASSFQIHSTSVRSPVSTGKTSVDSKFTLTSGQEKGQPNSGTVIARPHHGTHMRCSPEGNLTPIAETTLNYANVSILTVERAAAAKIYLETYFNALLSPDPSPRDRRRRKLEMDLYRRMNDENFTPEQQEMLRDEFCRRETEHLRECRVMKARSVRARTAEKGERAGRLDDEYELLKILGKGSFGVVRLVREKSRASLQQNYTTAKQVYAMKVIHKSDMLRTSQEGHLRAERDFLVVSEGSDW